MCTVLLVAFTSQPARCNDLCGDSMPTPSVSVFALVYGQSGLGKSTDMAATFPNALFVARPGGMQSAQSFLGIEVAEAHVRTLEEVINLIAFAKQRGHDAIVVDDLSLLAESTERDLDAAMEAEGNRNKFAKYNTLNGLAASLREQGRYVGIHFAANAHERIAGTDAKGASRNGGPKLPSWNMGDSIVHEASLVLRVAKDAQRAQQWQTVYDCQYESIWTGKDRLTATAPRSPHNLRAILTAGGYAMSRAPGLEWQDEVTLAVAQKAADGQETADIVALLWPKLVGSAGLDPRHVAWAVRDGLATAELTAATANRFKSLFDFIPPTPAISAVFGS